MGIHHLRCPVSGLAIVSEEVMLIVVARVEAHWVPVGPPFRGTYDSYGSVDVEKLTSVMKQLLAGFKVHGEKETLTFPSKNDPLAGEVSVEMLKELLEEIRQGPILEEARVAPDQGLMVRANGAPLGFVMVLKSFYDAVVATVAGGPDGKNTAGIAPPEFDALVAKTLGLPAVSRELVRESRLTHEALFSLALFRFWFDARGSWAPFVGVQYSGRDIRQQLTAARKALSEWPRLMAGLDWYEKDSLRLRYDE